MAKFKNISPLGALEIPALGIIAEPGEVFEVPAALARYFQGQAGTFDPVRVAAPPKLNAAEKRAAKAASVAPSGADDSSPDPGTDLETEAD